MKKLAVIMCAVLQLGCGSSFLDKTVYRVFTYEPDGIETEETIMGFTQTVKDSLYQLQYCSSPEDDQQNCYQYTLVDEQTKKEQIYTDEDGNDEPLWLTDFRNYTLNGKDYSVYKYLMNVTTTDGQSAHFWCPDFGIIIVKSTTWRNFKQLVSLPGNSQDHAIQALCEVVYNDQSFYTNRSEVQADSLSLQIIDQMSDSLDNDLENQR